MLHFDPAVLDYPGGHDLHLRLIEALRPKPDYLVSDWADDHRILSARHADQAGRWMTSKAPFLREIQDNLSARSPVQITSLMKGAQLGGTECANNWVGYTVHSDPVPMLYVCPTATVMKRTSARIQQMVDDDPKGLGTKILPARKRDAKNSQIEKHFPGGALYFATGNSATNLRSTMVKRIVLDELDAYPQDVDGEGSVIGVAERRGTTAGDSFKQLEISTPGVDQTSLIKRRFLKGDQRRYCMPCPHCSNLISFEWENFTWEEGKPETVRYKCKCCAEPIHETKHKKAMLAAGMWVPKIILDDADAMIRLSAGDRSELDAHNVTALRRSYYMPSFLATIGLTWRKIIQVYEEAAGSEPDLKVFWTTLVGIPYVAPGEAPSWEKLKALKVAFRARQLPAWTTFLTAGADPGTDHVEVHIWAYGRRRRRHLVESIRVDGPVGEQSTWDQVTAIVNRLYLHPNGAVLPIRRFLIDRRHAPDAVDRWVATQNRYVVIACMGSEQFDADMIKWVSRKQKAEDIQWGVPAATKVLRLGVSMIKLEFYGYVNVKAIEGKDVPVGMISLNSDATDEVCKQLVSEHLTFVSVNGARSKPRWRPVGASRHEALDCAGYSRAGAEVEGWSRWSEDDFAREDMKMVEQARSIDFELRVLQHRRQTEGDERPVTLKDLFPSLVLPGDSDAEVVGKVEAEPVDELPLPSQVPAAAAPAVPLVITATPVPPPADAGAWAGVKKSWGNGARQGPAVATTVNGIVRCTEDRKSLLTPVTIEADHD